MLAITSAKLISHFESTIDKVPVLTYLLKLAFVFPVRPPLLILEALSSAATDSKNQPYSGNALLFFSYTDSQQNQPCL